MFEISREEQQQARASKLVQSIKDTTADLRMDELVEPTTILNINNVIQETFGDCTRMVNP